MKQRLIWMCVLLLLLAGCASSGGRLVQPGANPAGSRLTIDSEMEWTRMSTMRYQLWTIDGELLNRLYLVPAVREGEYIFLGHRQTTRRPDGPFYKRGMRADELRDLVADGLRMSGAVNVVSTNLRPIDFGGREGLRFDFSLSNEEGLAYQGMAAAFEHEKGLALAIFLAPREYYYPRDAEKVSKMLDTLRWK
ncbi:hypothetical protein [Lysobacter sp. CFH 32150]|uniref:hypothetical protein n=1 Tax=Lysobacter sp. CFH 32150 TaxID=2927128 RepID=UPI001FA7BF57|nr:hypothetical protein [Lysobacter sp. CFH 32150]MCI4569262.1 hypothetical protein [Lysobacter sp. CFH 32150]